VWPVKTREQVDLWLHGFAMLQEDTTFVPFFKRGYSTEMIVLKNRANVVTQLDANREKLRARLATNPQLINAQFVPLSFSTWAELSQTVDLFVRANGDPRAASSQQQAGAIAFLAAYFPTGPDPGARTRFHVRSRHVRRHRRGCRSGIKGLTAVRAELYIGAHLGTAAMTEHELAPA